MMHRTAWLPRESQARPEPTAQVSPVREMACKAIGCGSTPHCVSGWLLTLSEHKEAATPKRQGDLPMTAGTATAAGRDRSPAVTHMSGRAISGLMLGL